MKCKHCHKNSTRQRGLCWGCYKDRTIRDQYPSESKYNPKRFGFKADHEPTEEELEATIAEQRQCLPAWWDEETRRMLGGLDETPAVRGLTQREER